MSEDLSRKQVLEELQQRIQDLLPEGVKFYLVMDSDPMAKVSVLMALTNIEDQAAQEEILKKALAIEIVNRKKEENLNKN